MSELSETFSGLSSAFGTKFVEDKKEKALTEIDTRRKELMELSGSESLEDKEYMQFEIKQLIMNGMRVLDTLEQDIRIGTKPRTHEVYFNGLEKVRNLISELREINKTNVELMISQEKLKNPTSGGGTTNNIIIDSKDLLKMVKNAKTKSSLNEVKAEFKIEEQDKR